MHAMVTHGVSTCSMVCRLEEMLNTRKQTDLHNELKTLRTQVRSRHDTSLMQGLEGLLRPSAGEQVGGKRCSERVFATFVEQLASEAPLAAVLQNDAVRDALQLETPLPSSLPQLLASFGEGVRLLLLCAPAHANFHHTCYIRSSSSC